MVACFSCTPDALSRRNTLPIANAHRYRKSRFGSQEAVILLQKCNNFDNLKLVHAKIVRNGLCHDQLLLRKVLNLCSSYGKIDYASRVFYQIGEPQTFTWNTMIRAYTINDCSRQAILLYNLMICQGFCPDKFTFPFVVKACLASRAIHKGKEVYGLAIKSGFPKDTFLHNTLMNLYFKCMDVDSGNKVFDKMHVRTIVSWTTLISGLVACGEIEAARAAFEEMPTKNVVSWTAMIDGYVRCQQPEEVFRLFQRMQLDNVRPNQFTLVSLFKACSQLESLELGRKIHKYALNNGFKIGVFLGTALIDMYSKCGSLKNAREIFDEMQTKNLATWNTMITSLGVHGYGEDALTLFAQMEEVNVKPDAITFVGVLCACVQTNKVSEAIRYFRYMKPLYGVEPISEHYSCMVELFNRAKMSEEVSALDAIMTAEQNGKTTFTVNMADADAGIADAGQFFQSHDTNFYCFGDPVHYATQISLSPLSGVSKGSCTRFLPN